MKRTILIVLMVVAVVFSVSAMSPAESRLSVQGGYGAISIKPEDSDSVSQKAPFVSMTDYTRYSLDSNLIWHLTSEYTINDGIELHDASTLDAVSFKSCFGVGYNIDSDPFNVIIGLGIHDRLYIGTHDFVLFSFGASVLADLQYDFSRNFYLDFSAGYDYGLFGEMYAKSNYNSYSYKMKTSEYYARLGVGLRFK